MKLCEAETLIGKTVRCFAAYDGIYTGILLDTQSNPNHSTWWGKVKILEVCSYPSQWSGRHKSVIKIRKPFPFGTIRDFSGKNITPCNMPISDYDTSLAAVLTHEIQLYESSIEISKFLGQDYMKRLPGLEELKKALRELDSTRRIIPCMFTK